MILRSMLHVCVLALLSVIATEVLAADEADQLRTIERSRLRSLVEADIETARRLHADDFQLVNPRGGTLTRDQYLSDIASGNLDYLEWEPGEIQVRLHGETAVIRYKANIKISIQGSPALSVKTWHTDLYEKRQGQWQAVWSQATLIEEE